MRSGTRPVVSSPFSRTVPALGVTRPISDLMKVDLPAPLGPKTSTCSLWPTTMSTPNRICSGP